MAVPATQSYLPRVAVVVPVLNEAASIGACLQSLIDQVGFIGPIIVMDGGSTDGTLAILAEWQRCHDRISLRTNPERLQAAALNLAAETLPASVAVIVRADAHAVYPPAFVQTCVAALHAQDATSVVVPMRTVGKQGFQRAAAAAQSSWLGTGGSPHRSAGASRLVDHGHHAAFDRAFFRRVGGYDTNFTHNEDAEHDLRALAAGGRIWLCAEAAIDYLPRSTLIKLARQYRNHGRGRARTLLLHHRWPRARQMLPMAALLVTLGGLALAPLNPAFGLAPLAYGGICVGYGVVLAWRTGDAAVAASGVAAITMHLSWAWGFLESGARHWLAAAGLPRPPQGIRRSARNWANRSKNASSVG